MSEVVAQLALLGGLAWASGVRLYATVFVAGLAARAGWIALPGDLSAFASDPVLYVSGGLMLAEFLADKIPAFDSVWDAVHSFIRVPAGLAIGWQALEAHGAGAQLAAALIAGTITSGAHFTKAGTRLAINHSPEPFSNWGASLGEDLAAPAALWLAIAHPYAFLALLGVFLLLAAWLLPKLFRVARGLWRRLSGRAATAPG